MSAFAYSDQGATTVHPDLDPYCVSVRESRDSDEHPESVAIAVLFDVTGSMGYVPRILQTRLPDLLSLLLRKGYVERDFWRGLLGQQVLFLDDPDAVCETIALTIGLAEDAIDLDAGLAHLRDVGSTAGASVTRALASR